MAFDPKRIDRLAAKATLLEEQVRALVAELEELAELARIEATARAAAPASRPEREPEREAEPIAEPQPQPIVAHDPEPVPAPEPVAESDPDSERVPDPVSVAESIPEGARLVALNMALSGTRRDETARYLRDNYQLEDPDPLLDDVYAKAGS
jgi:outer membrane biosynthesis protein TonB